MIDSEVRKVIYYVLFLCCSLTGILTKTVFTYIYPNLLWATQLTIGTTLTTFLDRQTDSVQKTNDCIGGCHVCHVLASKPGMPSTTGCTGLKFKWRSASWCPWKNGWGRERGLTKRPSEGHSGGELQGIWGEVEERGRPACWAEGKMGTAANG